MQNSIYSIVLAGGPGTRLNFLTRKMAKPVVPVAATTNTLSLALGALLGCNFNHIDVYTQYKHNSIEDYIQKYWRPILDHSVRLQTVPPEEHHAYRGTAHAVHSNVAKIKASKCSHVIITAADGACWIDYEKLLKFCLSKHADVVIMAMPVPKERAAKSLGVLGVNEDHRVYHFEEKPDEPKPMPGHPEKALASMGIYIFKADFLIKTLEAIYAEGSGRNDFGKDVIPMILTQDANKVFAYYFTGYWDDLGSFKSYYNFHMNDLLGSQPSFNPYVNPFNSDLCFRQLVLPPANVHDAVVTNGAIISSGCIVHKSMLEKVVLSPGVTIETGVNLNGAIIHYNAKIGHGSHLEKVIICSNTVIPPNTVITPEKIDYPGEYHREHGITMII